MRATLYQDSPARASPRPLAGRLALALLAAGSMLACKQPPAPAAPAPSAPTDEATAAPTGRSIHFSLLTRFAPERLLDFTAGPLGASTSRFGGVSVTEIERTYEAGERRLELRIVDSNINRGAKSPKVAEPYETAHKIGRPLTPGSAVGYVEFDKTSGQAHADLVVAERLLLTLDLENAEGPLPLERFCAALDVAGMEQLVQAQGPRR